MTETCSLVLSNARSSGCRHPYLSQDVAAVMAFRDITGYSLPTFLVTHSVSLVLLEQNTAHLSAAQWLRYSAVL